MPCPPPRPTSSVTSSSHPLPAPRECAPVTDPTPTAHQGRHGQARDSCGARRCRQRAGRRSGRHGLRDCAPGQEPARGDAGGLASPSMEAAHHLHLKRRGHVHTLLLLSAHDVAGGLGTPLLRTAGCPGRPARAAALSAPWEPTLPAPAIVPFVKHPAAPRRAGPCHTLPCHATCHRAFLPNTMPCRAAPCRARCSRSRCTCCGASTTRSSTAASGAVAVV